MAHQMDIYECIEVATTGSDGKPPVQSARRDMQIPEHYAASAAHEVVDDAVEVVEHRLGLELTEQQWEQVTLTLTADFAEAIQEAFGAL